MSANATEWIGVVAFFLIFWVLTFGEAAWLSKKGWAPFGTSFLFSLITNLVGLVIGSTAVGIILLFMFMLVFEPKGGRSMTEAMMWIGVFLVFLFPPIFLMLTKRLSLRIFKMGNDRPVWVFCAAASFITVFLCAGLPFGLLSLMVRIG